MSRVSVIIAAYNAEKYIEEAVTSILQQTYEDWELLVIDDGSKDSTYQILSYLEERDNRIKVFKNDGNRGVAYTRNRLFEIAQSEYVAILDADDIAISNRLELQVDYMDAHENITACFGNDIYIDKNGNVINYGENFALTYRQVNAEMIFHNVLSNSTAMVRKKFIDDCRVKYRDNMCGVEDYLFWYQCIENGAKCVVIDQYLCRYRIVDTGLTIDNLKNNSIERRNSEYLIADEILRFIGVDLKGIDRRTFFFWFWSGGTFIQRQFYLFFIPKMIRSMNAKYSDSESEEYVCAVSNFVKAHRYWR